MRAYSKVCTPIHSQWVINIINRPFIAERYQPAYSKSSNVL